MADLPKIGFYAEVQNSAGFQKASAAVDAALARVSEVAKASADKVNTSLTRMESQFKGAFDKVAKTVANAGDKIKHALSIIESAIKGVASLITGVLLGALSALTLGFTALIGLMSRGANFQGIIDSFERLTGSIHVSASALLNDLRVAAQYTISDMELLRMTNVALAGATGEFATQFAERLPEILRIAGAQARSTGQDVDYLFNSLITGIKRGSPMLIDNTGLVLRIEEANKAYADSIGVTVEQMTAEQKQLALLNAVMEAGAAATETLGEAQLTNAQRIAQFGTLITNIFDRISMFLQPIFAQMLGTINYFLMGVQNLLDSAAPYIAAIVQQITSFLSSIFGSVEAWSEGMNSPTAARNFFMGAANTFGAFLRGVVIVATQIMQVISDLAAGIASFLLGSSPPPEGPLHEMERGARATMRAYLEAISDTDLDPVEKVAARINHILGGFGNLNENQIDLRFAQLDRALQPFVDQLALAEASYARLSISQGAALDNVNEQLDSAVIALRDGDAGAAELVRNLDAQRQQLERSQMIEQERIEAARQQLALAEANQAMERARLEARQDELAILERIRKAREAMRPDRTPGELGVSPTGDSGSGGGSSGGGGAGAGETPGGGGGGAGELPAVAGGGAGGAAATFENLFEFDAKEIAAAGEQISKGFMEGLGAGTLENFGTVRAGLEANVSSLGSAFDALPARIEAIGTQVSNAIQTNIVNPIEIWFAQAARHFDSSQFGTFAYYVATLGTRIGIWLGNVGQNFEAAFVTPIQTFITNNIAPLFADATTPGSIPFFFAQLIPNVTTALITWGNSLQVNLIDPLVAKITNFIQPLLDVMGNPDSIAFQFFSMIGNTVLALATWGNELFNTFVQPVLDTVGVIAGSLTAFFAGTETGSLSWIISQAVDYFTEFPARIGEALSTARQFVMDSFVSPIIDVLNAVIGGFEGMLRSLVGPVADLLDTAAQIANALPGGGFSVAALHEAATNLRGTNINLPRVELPGAARGGMFGPGLLRVGEKGEELIANSARRLSVFPNNFMSAIQNLAPQPQALPTGGVGGGSVYNNSSESNAQYNFNNMRSDSQVMQRIALLRSLG